MGKCRLRVPDFVLFMICLMYLITYIDRGNLAIVAPAL
jgi:hypothetical protein